MLVACWSVKGGSGTTVVAAALALILSRSAGVVAADLGGDLPAVLGLPEPGGPGIGEWAAAPPDLPSDALRRLLVPARPGLDVLPRGAGPVTAECGERLGAALGGFDRVVVDCGAASDPAGLAVAGSATVSLLVLRPCYLALRRALSAPIRPSGVVLVSEPGRALGTAEVADVLGVPVRARVPWEPTVARCVDAGLLGGRVPRSLERALREAA